MSTGIALFALRAVGLVYSCVVLKYLEFVLDWRLASERSRESQPLLRQQPPLRRPWLRRPLFEAQVTPASENANVHFNINIL